MSDKPTNLRDKIKETTTQEILAAAEWELAEHGLAATSMNAIARRAGVSVGTLYNYFKDKDILLISLFADRKEQLRDSIARAMESHGDLPFATQLEEVVRATLTIFDSQRNFLRIILTNEKPPIEKGAHKNAKSPAMIFIDGFRPIVERGVKNGILDPEDADLYASALAAIIRGVMIERLAAPERSFTEATKFVMRVFLEGAKKR